MGNIHLNYPVLVSSRLSVHHSKWQNMLSWMPVVQIRGGGEEYANNPSHLPKSTHG